MFDVDCHFKGSNTGAVHFPNVLSCTQGVKGSYVSLWSLRGSVAAAGGKENLETATLAFDLRGDVFDGCPLISWIHCG